MLLDRLAELHSHQHGLSPDGAIQDRIKQYEMAFNMQSSVPEVADLKKEPESIYDLYGKEAKNPGSFAANCLMARRLAERGVKFIQLYHQGWDQHGGLKSGISRQCKETDQASAALIKDLKQRGMLDETLVVWAENLGEPTTLRANSARADLVVTTTRAASRCGWQAAASSPESPLEKLTITATTLSINQEHPSRRININTMRMRFMSMTCKLRSCISWASITPLSPINSKGVTTDLLMSMVKW
jgi:hypothetical protein